MQYKKKFVLYTAASLALPLGLSACGIGGARGSSLYNGLRPPAEPTYVAPAAPAPPPPAPAPPAVVKPSQTSVYFDLDKSVIKPEGDAIISAWAAYLIANPSAKVVAQANTDERGSSKYNIALGERRASAVVAALLAKGVSIGQLTTVNYGAEKPRATTKDEAGFATNRRVDINLI